MKNETTSTPRGNREIIYPSQAFQTPPATLNNGAPYQSYPNHDDLHGQAPALSRQFAVNVHPNSFSNANDPAQPLSQYMNGHFDSPQYSTSSNYRNAQYTAGINTHQSLPNYSQISQPTSFERTSVMPHQVAPLPQTAPLLSPFRPSAIKIHGNVPSRVPRRHTMPVLPARADDRSDFEMPTDVDELTHRDPNPPHIISLIPGRSTTVLNAVDNQHVQFLVNCMQDMDHAEDKLAMRDQWRKILKEKPTRIRDVCVQILEAVDTAAATRESLTSRKPMHVYNSFAERFKAISNTLLTQKTVCKHLIEEPYLCQVVDDPAYATKRVVNNRRVNDQKRETIQIGRHHMRIKGRGKGNALLKVEHLAHSQKESSSAADSDGSEYEGAVSRRTSSRRKAVKRQRKDVGDDDDYEPEPTLLTPPKRPRRGGSTRKGPMPPVPTLDTSIATVSTGTSNDVSTDSPANANFSYAPNTPDRRQSMSTGLILYNHGLSNHSRLPLTPSSLVRPSWDQQANLQLNGQSTIDYEPVRYPFNGFSNDIGTLDNYVGGDSNDPTLFEDAHASGGVGVGFD